MKDAPQQRVVIDFDKATAPVISNEKRCDYLFIAEGVSGRCWVAPLELKKGRLHAQEAVQQLQEGALAAEQLVPPNEAATFRPVAATGSVSKIERILLRKAGGVRFHGRREEVRLMKCGMQLVQRLGI